MIVQRGFPSPPSLHEERLRKAPVGHFFDVITNGYGIMYPYASRVTTDERWAIIAYIRALQLSQHATLDDVDPVHREQLQAGRKMMDSALNSRLNRLQRFGDELEVISKSPFGSPISFKHGQNSFFALRKNQANLIEIE